MRRILPATNVVLQDEPCYWLTERHLQSPGSRGLRRFQILWVVRGDRLHEHVTDLGPASRYNGVPQFNVQGGVTDEQTGRIWIEHTVAELRDIADAHRAGLLGAPTQYEPTDMKTAWFKQLDRKRLEARRQSVFGAYHRVERH